MRLHRIQAGHCTCEARARVRWPGSEGETLMPVFIRIRFEDEWLSPAWALTVDTIPTPGQGPESHLVEHTDVCSDTLRDMRAMVTHMLTDGWWEYRFSIGWCWIDEKRERKKLLRVLADSV